MPEKIKSKKGFITLPASILLGAIIIAVAIVFVFRTSNPPATNQKALTIENYNRPAAETVEELATSTEEQSVATTTEKKLYFKLLGNELLRECPAADCKIVQWGTSNGIAEIIKKSEGWYRVKVYEHGKYVPTEDCPPCGHIENLEQPIITEGWFHESLINESALVTLDPTVPPPLKTVTVEPKPVSKPEQVMSPQTFIPPAPQKPQDNLPPVVDIDPQSIVGVLCYYNTTITNPLNWLSVQGDQYAKRGTGVIIDKRGYILTNRHVVSTPAETTQTITVNDGQVTVVIGYKLDHCEAGQILKGTQLPSDDEIRTFNPAIRIPVLAYNAKIIYGPSIWAMSNDEIDKADFDILQITSLTQDASIFGVTSLPQTFPFSKLLAGRPYLKSGDPIVTFGFPGDITEAQHNFFQTMDMTGSLGRITQVEFGDHYYADTLLTIHTKMEIYHGRSGSPLFWRGYVIGLVTRFDSLEDRTQSASVASDAIIKSLKSIGYDPSLN